MKLSQALTSLALGSAAMLAPAGAQRAGLEVGQRFPEVVLPSLDGGEPLSIGAFRGRKVVLHVWASW